MKSSVEDCSQEGPSRLDLRCVALAGGVGGARLCDGLYRVLAPHRLTVIGNTGDDFDHFGLRVCPDLDTVMYTLAGLASRANGWGIEGDTHHAMDMLARYGEETWFAVGDRDLATDVRRTALLRQGLGLGEVTRVLCEALGIRARLLPMTDRHVPSFIVTASGERLAFQEYFVKRHHQDAVARIEFDGMEDARPLDEALGALEEADVIVYCPSNPFVSIGPILAVPGLADAVTRARARRVAVSPIVGGRAVRGPAADMLRSLGHEPGVRGVAALPGYKNRVNVMVVDEEDAGLADSIRALGMEVRVAPTIMRCQQDREALAREVLAAGLVEVVS